MRIALLGLDERMSAQRAHQIGLVSEVLPRAGLWERGAELARIIAAKPPAAVQGTVRAVWESLDAGRTQALRSGLLYTHIGNPIGVAQVDRSAVSTRAWTLR
jgi:enoyl-CoA hydratase/carnithine racemase